MVARESTKINLLLERAGEMPRQPGVYLMKDAYGRILYVGKAKSLRARVRSYFQSRDDLHPRTQLLVSKISDIEFTVTHNELEALLLECNLIKKHRPRYNVRLKDDKAYPYVVLDFTHPFPQFRISRKVIPLPNLRYFGPFSAGVNEIGRFLLKTFQIRDCTDAKFKNRTRPCLNYEIGTCTAPCVNYVNETDYAAQVAEAVLFLKGKKQALLKKLKTEMETASERQEYERAKSLRDRIYSIERLTEKQGAVLTDGAKDVDIVGCYEAEGTVQWVVMFVRSGLLTGRRGQRTSLGFSTLEEAMRTFLEQFYTVSLIPDEVWVGEEFEDRKLIEAFLTQRAGRPIAVRVRRNEKGMRLLGMAYENAKLLHQEGTGPLSESASERLRKVLDLKDCPHSIEGIDVSNFQGKKAVASLVHFADERPLKARYRLFNPRTVEGQDDFATIYETVLRRFSKPENPPPDLLMIDGGKGQLAAALKALQELNLDVPLCSLAKARTERGFTRKEVSRSEERIFIPYRKNPIVLRETDPGLRLLQRVRDEAHRFAIESHRRRRKKGAFEESDILDIGGIGEKSRVKLLKELGSLEAIRSAEIPALVAAGLTQPQAESVYRQFHSAEEE